QTAGSLVRARSAIVAIPPALCERIAFDPPLPPTRAQLQQRVPHGSTIKVQVVYDEPFWRRDGLSGQALDPSAPIAWTADNSPADGSCGVIVSFFEGRTAIRFSSMSVDDRRAAVVTTLGRHFGQKALAPQAYHDLDWSAEVWTRGCYGGHFPPGVWTQFGPALREPVARIHWAGTETGTVWNGYMDGAVRSGERAAAEVAAELE
ncbi:MAG TPA: FAD-dependent oxidoreductase, partial [Actinomycetota bacterium]|nr:FAD-dependent oxidoreductase [Actinomycetota bacterium]